MKTKKKSKNLLNSLFFSFENNNKCIHKLNSMLSVIILFLKRSVYKNSLLRFPKYRGSYGWKYILTYVEVTYLD